MPERRGAFRVEGLCVSVFWGRCVGLLLSCFFFKAPSSMLAMGADISGGGKHKKAKASVATAAAAPTAMAPPPFVQPSVVEAIQGVQQVCSSSTVVSAGSTVRLNRLHRRQPCTVERHLPTH